MSEAGVQTVLGPTVHSTPATASFKVDIKTELRGYDNPVADGLERAGTRVLPTLGSVAS